MIATTTSDYTTTCRKRIGPQIHNLHALSDGLHHRKSASEDHGVAARVQAEPPLHVYHMQFECMVLGKSNNRYYRKVLMMHSLATLSRYPMQSESILV